MDKKKISKLYSLAWRGAVVLAAVFVVLLYLYGFVQEALGNYRIPEIRKTGVIKGQLQPPIPGITRAEQPDEKH